MLLAKGLPLEAVGDFALALAVATPVFMLANARLRNVLVVGGRSDNDFNDFFYARIATTFIAVFTCVVIAVVLPIGTAAKAVICVIALAKGCDAISDICQGFFQGRSDLRTGAIGLIINGISSVILVGAAVVLRPSVVTAAIGYLGGSLVALWAWDIARIRLATWRVAPRESREVRPRVIVGLLRKAAPLGFSNMLGSLQSNIPRYLVGLYLGSASLAIFSALAYLPILGGLLVNAIGQAALPALTQGLANGGHAHWRRLRSLVALGLVIGLSAVGLTLLVGEPVIRLAYTSEYAAHADVLIWIVGAAAISYAFVFLGTGATARLRFKAQLMISVLGTLTLLVSARPLILTQGLRGAALAVALAAFVEAAAYTVLTIRDMAHYPARTILTPSPQ